MPISTSGTRGLFGGLTAKGKFPVAHSTTGRHRDSSLMLPGLKLTFLPSAGIATMSLEADCGSGGAR